MKILHFSISVVFLAVLCNAGIAHGELVPKTFTELYKEYQGKMIITGQVISTSEIRANQTSYDIKILDYIINPQKASIITAVSVNNNSTTPIFHVGDNVQLYLDSGPSGYVLSPYSFKTYEKCTSFGPSYLDFEHPFSATASQPIRFVDSGGNVITPIVHQHNRMSYDIFNYSPLNKTTVDLQILLNDNPIPVFHDTKNIDLKPCTGKTMTWDFVPMQMGNYTDTIRQSWDVYENKIILGNYTLAADEFSPGPANTGSLSPLQQFKSGVVALDVECNKGFQLIFKAEDGSPVCVTPSTAQKLAERGWAYNTLSHSAHTIISMHTMNVTNSNLSVNYTITNAKILDIEADIKSVSIIINIQTSGDGNLNITVPRTLVEYPHSQMDPHLFVLGNGQEIDSKEIGTTSNGRTLSIPFNAGINQIEIIGMICCT